MKTKLFLLLLFVFSISLQAQTDWYVVPGNGQFGTGTETDPWDLQSALTNGNGVNAGDTIILAGGQYNGRYTSTISGTSANPITVKSADGEWAVLNGNVPNPYPTSYNTTGVLYVTSSSNVYFMDFEITSNEDIQPLTRDLLDPDYIGFAGVNHVGGEDCKFINLVIHDMPGIGVGSWKPTGGTEFYGCIVYNNGTVDANRRQYAHGFYIQNNTNKERVFNNNIVFNNFGKGLILWSSSQCGQVDPENGDLLPDANCDFLKNVLFENNTSFNNGNVRPFSIPVGNDNIEISTNDSSGFKIPKNVIVNENILYHNVDLNGSTGGTGISLSFGKVGGNPVENVTVTNNLVIGRNYPLRLFSTGNGFTFSGNKIWGGYTYTTTANMVNSSGWDFSTNRYYSKNGTPFRVDGTGDFTMSNWQTLTGTDSGSLRIYTNDFDTPSYGNNIFKITQNEYNSKKYTVVVVNPANLNDVTLDFSDFGFEGTGDIDLNAEYMIRDVENYNSLAGQGTVGTDYNISFSMNEVNFEAPLKPLDTFWEAPQTSPTLIDDTQKTPTNFGVFIIEFEEVCQDETTWDGFVWSNGQPMDNSKKAIINGNYNSTTHGEFEACSLVVNSSLVIEPNTTIIVHNNVINNSVADMFIIRDDASLVMIEDSGIVSGTPITVEKKFAEHLFSMPITPQDSDKYSIWSTPMVESDSQINNTFSGNAITYYWDTSLTPTAFDQFGGSENLIPGKGFYIRQNDQNAFYPETINSFRGTLNNGIIETQVYHDPTTDADNFHFFGNPYPSAIDWIKFKNDNSALVEGAVYFWRQVFNTIPGIQSPQWAILNEIGGLPYEELGDGTGTDGITGDGTTNKYISTSQGFVMSVKADGIVEFNNSQREVGNNDQFFRTQNSDDDKLWLSLSDANIEAQILLGFVAGCSDDYNLNCDAEFFDVGSSIEFYSVIGKNKLSIQGRDTLVNNSSSVPLGFKITRAGTYTFDIVADFISPNYQIILEDTLTSTFTDLRTSNYDFYLGAAIEDNTRFILHFNYSPPLDASFAFEKACESLGFDFDFFYVGDSTNLTFAWDFGPNASPQTSTDENPTNISFTEGNHDVTLTISNGVSNGISTQTITAVDVATVEGGNIMICHDGNTKFIKLKHLSKHLAHGDCVGACEDDIIVCHKGNQTKAINNPEDLENHLAHGDTLGICDLNDKKDDKNSKEHTVIESENKLTLYPNPTSDILNVNINSDNKFNTIKVLDLSGRIMYKSNLNGTNKTEINVSDFSNGIYFVAIQTNDGQRLTRKFIKK